MKNLLKKTLLLLLTLTLLTACSMGNSPTSGKENTSVPVTENTTLSSEETVSDAHYPVTITNYNYAGEEVTTTYEKAPEKVLAVYQGSIETMIALGLQDHVVASYRLDNEVKEESKDGLSKMHYDESVFAPDKETVTAMAPDMILSWGSIFSDKKLGDVAQWEAKGTHCYMNTNTRPGGYPRTIENECQDLLNIGKIFNVEDKAQELVNEMQAEIDKALTETEGKDQQSVAVIELWDDAYSNYGASSLAGDMVTQLGGELVFPDSSQISKEDLVIANPDVIFVVYMPKDNDIMASGQEKVAAITEDPALSSLSAVQNQRVFPVMLGDVYASTVRTIDGLKTMSHALYPELNK